MDDGRSMLMCHKGSSCTNALMSAGGIRIVGDVPPMTDLLICISECAFMDTLCAASGWTDVEPNTKHEYCD